MLKVFSFGHFLSLPIFFCPFTLHSFTYCCILLWMWMMLPHYQDDEPRSEFDSTCHPWSWRGSRRAGLPGQAREELLPAQLWGEVSWETGEKGSTHCETVKKKKHPGKKGSGAVIYLAYFSQVAICVWFFFWFVCTSWPVWGIINGVHLHETLHGWEALQWVIWFCIA